MTSWPQKSYRITGCNQLHDKNFVLGENCKITFNEESILKT